MNLYQHIYIYFVANAYGLPEASADSSQIQSVLSIVFAIAGALAILMIIISGFSYITSSGDPQKAAKARNGILYSVIGLVVCILAEVIVNFVIGSL